MNRIYLISHQQSKTIFTIEAVKIGSDHFLLKYKNSKNFKGCVYQRTKAQKLPILILLRIL